MIKEWQELTGIIGDQEIVISKVSVPKSGITIEGEFRLPPLASLPYEEQVFVAMFIRSHGSIKEMEQAFGVSYPTIKARLNRICEKLGFVQSTPVSSKEEILSMLERGELSVDEALKRMG